MNFLCLLIISNIAYIAMNGTFIDEYISPLIRPFCDEKQERIHFKYTFRGRKQKNINSHVVYLFTEDKVFSVSQMTASLNIKENYSYVIPEIFFNEVKVKDVTEFWDGKHPNETFNSVFSDPLVFDMSFWLSGDKYRPINVSDADFKVTAVQEPIEFSTSEYGFMKNDKIKNKGFQNIFGVDIADAGSFLPIRVYVRDTDPENEGKSISFAFYEKKSTNEEFENGKHYKYSFNSAVYLVTATSLANKIKKEQYNNYFELRTRLGRFSLFDFTNNRDFLLVGTTEELLGCPPSFCQSREFDDIIRLHNGTKLLVFHEWIWKFNKPGERIVWEEAVISSMSSRNHITRFKNFGKPFKFGIRHIIDGSFIDDSKLYLFRNGSFITSENDSIIESSVSFEDYKPIGEFFKGLPSQTFDALFYHKESRIVFFIKEDKYWAYSMSQKSLISEDFPKHIENLGLPYDFRVKSSYVEEDDSGKQIKFYLFTENRFIFFEETEFKDSRFKARKHTYYCIAPSFFGCHDQHFVCPELETDDESEEEFSYIWIFVIILIVIIILLISIIAIIIVYNSFGKKSEKEKNISSDKKKSISMSSSKEKSADKTKTVSQSSSYSETARSKI